MASSNKCLGEHRALAFRMGTTSPTQCISCAGNRIGNEISSLWRELGQLDAS